jgi:chaperone BCS1
MNICMVHLSNKNLSDDKLNSLLLNTPYSSIILLEDIDHALNAAKRPSKRGHNYDDDGGDESVTLAGLLNCIDGVIAQEGRLVFMTTNHVTKLPPALVRPGRVDMSMLVDYASDEQIEQMFLNFYPKEISAAKQFINELKSASQKPEEGAEELKISTAALQGHFLQFKDNPNGAVQQAKDVLHAGRFDNVHDEE